MIRKDNLVILKPWAIIPKFETTSTDFKNNTFYRSLELTDGDNSEILVYGVAFNYKSFNELFEYAYDKIMRDFKSIGLLKPDSLKPLSKTAFKKLANIHTFTTRGIYRAYFFNNPKECLYSFETPYKENKKTFIDTTYKMYLDLINGVMDNVDNDLIQFGNTGIPLTLSKLRVNYFDNNNFIVGQQYKHNSGFVGVYSHKELAYEDCYYYHFKVVENPSKWHVYEGNIIKVPSWDLKKMSFN